MQESKVCEEIMKTSEIFEKGKVLTVARAKELKGKKIICSSREYEANTPHIREFVVGEIISEWDDAATRVYPDQGGRHPQYSNFQDYWRSYMDDRRIDEMKTRLLLTSNDGERQYVAHTKYHNFYPEPTFTGSDADREVYFVE